MTTGAGTPSSRSRWVEFWPRAPIFCATMGMLASLCYYYNSRNLFDAILVGVLIAFDVLAYAAVFFRILPQASPSMMAFSVNSIGTLLIGGNRVSLCVAVLFPWLIALPISSLLCKLFLDRRAKEARPNDLCLGDEIP